MKLSAKQIRDMQFSIKENKYQSSEVDRLLDMIVEDYKNIEASNTNETTFIIPKNYNGEFVFDVVKYEGSIAEWQAIENKGIFEDVPSIKCKDGTCIQKL